MHRERLERLACLLDNYRDDNETRFDLETWGKSIKTEWHGGFLWLRKKQHICNTAACAVGLACLSGEFARDGLRYIRDEFGQFGQIRPLFAGHKSWGAVTKFFELAPRQADRLFSRRAYKISTGEAGAKAVAKRIRSMIKPRVRRAKKRATDITPLQALLHVPVIPKVDA